MADVKFRDVIDTISEEIPKYRKAIFKALIIGMIVGESNKCISGIFRMFEVLMFSMGISRRCFYGFLQSGKLPLGQVWNKLLGMFGESLMTAGRLILLLDDTTYGKTGRKIAGCDTHFDHASKINSSKYIHGHCRVLLGVLAFVHNRWACLPISNGLYRLKKSVNNEQFKTKIEIAGNLIRQASERFSCNILIATDSWFGNKSLIKALGKELVERINILTRLRKDTRLYDIFVENNTGKRGRKRKYGKKLPTLSKMAESLERIKEILLIYGRQRECEYSEFIAMHRGFMRQVKVVLIHSRNGYIFPIVSTDLSLSAKQMIEYYSARWKIESGFKELKHELGAIDNQARKRESVENHFELCSIAQTTAWLYALKQTKAPERKYISARSTLFTFGDIRRKISNELYENPIFDSTCYKGLKSLENIFLFLLLRRSA
jgi:SRSO17 transposase